MIYRVAVATSDGVVVNQHFGHAESFAVLEVDEEAPETFRFVERRQVAPVCQNRNHDEAHLAENVQRLADCNFLLASKVGPGAAYQLEAAGISVYEIPGLISDSIAKMIAHIKLQKLLFSDDFSKKEA